LEHREKEKERRMKKEEYIKRYGKAAYEKLREHGQAGNKANPEKFAEHKHELSRKGGRYYQKALMRNRMGLRGARRGIPRTHQNKYRPYKKIISQDSQLHHQWIPETSKYTGVALVEADQRMHGFIDVIESSKGNITMFTEKEIREQ
jgi:hypothetical protein